MGNTDTSQSGQNWRFGLLHFANDGGPEVFTHIWLKKVKECLNYLLLCQVSSWPHLMSTNNLMHNLILCNKLLFDLRCDHAIVLSSRKATSNIASWYVTSSGGTQHGMMRKPRCITQWHFGDGTITISLREQFWTDDISSKLPMAHFVTALK